MPADLERCFSQLVAQPARGAMSAHQVAELIGKLKVSETRKSLCGQRLILYYQVQMDEYRKAMKGWRS